jgi:hypothetical protein
LKLNDLAITDFFAEHNGLQFRSEFFNLFNHANFGSTNTTAVASDLDNNASSSTFGQIRTAGPARVIQFGLKLMW